NNTATGYGGTAHFTSSDGQAVLSNDSTLSNGTGSFSATLKTAGNQTLTATDTSNSSITGTSNTIAVAAQAHADLRDNASGPASGQEGDSFTYNISMKNNGPADAHNVTLADVLPAIVALQSVNFGAATFSQSGQTVTIHLGTVAANATVTGTIV